MSPAFWTVSIVVAYLAGSIPFGLYIGRWYGIDIREHGSKNIGATNVGRVLGRPAGGLCFALDFLKGAMPVLVVGYLSGLLGTPVAELEAREMMLWLSVVVATILGHMYSPLMRFGGGKGIATGFGALAAMWPMWTMPVLGAFVVWAVVVRLTRYVAVASMAAAVSLPFFLSLWIVGDGADARGSLLHAWPPLFLSVLLALLIIFRHRTNIGRLVRGEEPKLGQSIKKEGT